MSPRAKTRNVQLVPPAAAELRQLRESAGLSQALLAERTGYDRKTITRWERGDQQPRDCVLEYLRALPGNSPKLVREMPSSFTFVDLFAGIGGLRMAFDAIGGRCLFTSEWDKYSQQTYRANFGEHLIHGDIVQIASDRIPQHDVLLAGFPCQPFSIAGVSKKNSLGRPHGFECDTQGTLFFEVERIIRHHRPRAFLLENVKNLQGHDGGKTFQTITTVLRKKLGYFVTTKVIDARCFVPQHRERIFIVGFREDVPFDWSMVALPRHEAWPSMSAVLHPEDGSETPEPPYTDSKGRVARKYTLSDHLWQYLQDYAEKHRAKGNGFGFGLVGPDDVARTLSARYFKDGSEILVRRTRGNPRRLTPRECARLMGFDRPSRPFKIPVSDTQAYRQFGNSVVVPLVEAVARAMRPFIVGQYTPKEQLALELAAAG
jgi:DNA (cytosine-5)-methyltransferase 1